MLVWKVQGLFPPKRPAGLYDRQQKGDQSNDVDPCMDEDARQERSGPQSQKLEEQSQRKKCEKLLGDHVDPGKNDRGDDRRHGIAQTSKRFKEHHAKQNFFRKRSDEQDPRKE